MPSVNGQVLSAAALHASMSISSFAPAARMFGWLASTASAGSFCLFSENGVVGLPLVTRTPPATPALAGIDAAMATASTAGTTASLIALIHIPLFFQPDADCGSMIAPVLQQSEHGSLTIRSIQCGVKIELDYGPGAPEISGIVVTAVGVIGLVALRRRGKAA